MQLALILALVAFLVGLLEVLVLGSAAGGYFEGADAPGLGAVVLGVGAVLAWVVPAALGVGLARALSRGERKVKARRIVAGITLALDLLVVGAVGLLVGPADLVAHATWMPRQVVALATSGGAEPAEPAEAPGEEPAEVVEPVEAEASADSPPGGQGIRQARIAVEGAMAETTFAALVPHLDMASAAGLGVRWLAFQSRAQLVLGWEGAEEGAAGVLDGYGIPAGDDPAEHGERLVPAGRAFLGDVVDLLEHNAGRDGLEVPWTDVLAREVERCGPGQPFVLEPAGEGIYELHCQDRVAAEVRWESGRWRLHLGSFDALATSAVDPVATYALRLDRPPAPPPAPVVEGDVKVFRAGEDVSTLPGVE